MDTVPLFSNEMSAAKCIFLRELSLRLWFRDLFLIFSFLLGADWGISGVGARVVLSLMIHVPFACCAAKWHVTACTQYLRYIALAPKTCAFTFISEVVPLGNRFVALQLAKVTQKWISGISGAASKVPKIATGLGRSTHVPQCSDGWPRPCVTVALWASQLCAWWLPVPLLAMGRCENRGHRPPPELTLS